MSQKGFMPIIFMLVILIVAGVGGAYYLKIQKTKISPSQTVASKLTQGDQISNWSLYTNSEVGFSLKYPDPLKVIIPQNNSNPNMKLKRFVFSDMTTDLNGQPVDQEISYQKLGGIAGTGGVLIYKGFWMNIQSTGAVAMEDEIANVISVNKNSAEVINVDGVTGYKRSSQAYGGGYSGTDIWVDIINDKKIYSIKASFPSGSKNNELLFNQILSTFKFTDQTDTSKWKTYGENTFEFRYPNDWTFNGIFNLPGDIKIAEFLGDKVYDLKPGETCLAFLENRRAQENELEKRSWGNVLSQEISREKISINGKDGARFVFRLGNEEWYPEDYCLSENGKAFKITFYEKTLNSERKALFDQILSTFKFN